MLIADSPAFPAADRRRRALGRLGPVEPERRLAALVVDLPAVERLRAVVAPLRC